MYSARGTHFEKHGFASSSRLAEGTVYSDYWIVGKYDQEVQNLLFSFSSSVEKRADFVSNFDVVHFPRASVTC